MSLLVAQQRVLLQVALDSGDWNTAMLLWPLDDPLKTDVFGCTEEQMRRVHSYRKAVSELQATHSRQHGTTSDGEGDGEQQSGIRRGRGRGRGRGGKGAEAAPDGKKE
jgi:hypothetical protein